MMPKRAVGATRAGAIGIDGAWEILENSPIIIDRYREVTMAYGYSGDSVLNSVSDAGFMVLGFLAASRMRWWHTVLIAFVFELLTLFTIAKIRSLTALWRVSPLETSRTCKVPWRLRERGGGGGGGQGRV